tara:strand:- start:881 stop:1381 length:501 start_codon:yes stop_codon:yes gene_type:complete
MSKNVKDSISLVPQAPDASPDVLERIREAFVEHLRVDRGIGSEEARRRAAETLGRELAAIRDLCQDDFLSIQMHGKKIGTLWKSFRIIEGRRTWHILYIEVDDANRQMGIAARAMRELIVLAKKDDVFEITLNVSPRNIPALALYKKLGFLERNGGLTLRVGSDES